MDLHIIHLEERTERFEQIQKHYKSYNIIPIQAIRHEIGRIGCFLSHQKCIRLAKEANMKYICVLEDDCIPIGSANHLLEIKNFLDNNDWNIFIGGGTGVWDDHVIRKIPYANYDLFEVTKIKTTHMICYHHSVYDFFLSIDPITNSIPIDKIWHKQFLAIIPVPFIATQSNGYSDIEKKEVQVDDKIKICNRYITDFCKQKFNYI